MNILLGICPSSGLLPVLIWWRNDFLFKPWNPKEYFTWFYEESLCSGVTNQHFSSVILSQQKTCFLLQEKSLGFYSVEKLGEDRSKEFKALSYLCDTKAKLRIARKTYNVGPIGYVFLACVFWILEAAGKNSLFLLEETGTHKLEYKWAATKNFNILN